MSSEHSLFRQEAIDARRGQWLGTINVATPLSRWTWTLLGVALAVIIVAFLVFGHYTRRERVSGQLVPNTGLLGVTAVQAGTVTRVFVHQGDTVQQGDPLVEISGERDSATMGGTRAIIIRQLHNQRDRLTKNLATQKQRTHTQTRALENKLHLLHAQQQQLAAQWRLQKQQADDAQAILQRIQPLREKGYVSALRLQQLKATALQDRAQLKTLHRQQLTTRQQINATQKQLAQLPLDLSSQTNAIASKIDDIDQQLAQNEAARASVLHAPRDGVITALLAKQGQHVAAGQSLASVVPAGATLQAQLLVPSRAIGFVEPGSQVVLRYQAYPYQKFGQQYGHVASISRSALSATEVLALTGQRAKQPLYRVKVALNRQSIRAYGQAQALKPGMALSADIMMDRRSLLEWLFEPLYGLTRQMQGGNHSHG